MGVRRLLLIRHGQYDERDEGTKDLTRTGRKQAALVGKALDDERIDAVYASTMLRARTTAALIAEPRKLLVASTPILVECIPTKVGFPVPAATIRDGRAQADHAYARYFKRSKTPRTELLVCHGNLIRYLVTKAMGMKAANWRNLAIYHASITDIRILSDGRAVLFSYNDVSHLPHKLRTMSLKAPRTLAKRTKASLENPKLDEPAKRTPEKPGKTKKSA